MCVCKPLREEKFRLNDRKFRGEKCIVGNFSLREIGDKKKCHLKGHSGPFHHSGSKNGERGREKGESHPVSMKWRGGVKEGRGLKRLSNGSRANEDYLKERREKEHETEQIGTNKLSP